MAKFLFTYTGGMAPGSPEEAERIMGVWIGWFKGIGAGVVDMGNPTGPTKVVGAGGSVRDEPSGPTGYSIISADSVEAAVAHANGCPVLQGGGTVIVSAINEMM